MVKRSFHLVSDKVAEADYFLSQMSETAPYFDAFRFNYSAFASAARSITFVLQSVMHEVPGFQEWYAERQAALKADPVARFFVEARNNVLKTGMNPITLGGWGGPGIERQIFWGLHPGEALRGAMRRSYEGEEIDRDVRDIARSYLTILLSVVRECFIEFRLLVDPLAIHSPAGMEANGWTLEDVEETWGYPRGYASSLCKSEDEKAHLLAYFASSCDDIRLNDFLTKYGLTPIPDLEDAA